VTVHPDAQRAAERFIRVYDVVAAQAGVPVALSPEQAELVAETIDELIRAEALFPGPSLYADK
jgi:hypothetical protein